MLTRFCNCFQFNSNRNSTATSTGFSLQKPDWIEENIEWKDTIPFVVPVTKGKVIKVYDGDTITIASKLPYAASPYYRFSVRLNGIDSPEIKGRTQREKDLAQESKKALETKLLNKRVTLKNVGTEKYGRVLADVYLDDIHINKWMLDNNYAVSYDGGTKIHL